jgi:uncharacterized repeat protein (TIGR01451 family)
MNSSVKFTHKVFALSALALAMSAPLHADEEVPLTLGETIDVTGTADAAPMTCTGTSPAISCPSLRSAIVHANSNANGATNYDVINLPAGTYPLTVSGAEDAGTSGDLDINEAVNIVGDGADTTIIDGGGDPGIGERIFTINGVAVSIDSVTMTNGFAKFELGGAIFNDEKSNLKLSNCAITNSTATWDGDYGELENETDGTVETQGSGGAIYSKDKLSIDNCVFRGNVAETYLDTGIPDTSDHGDEEPGNIIVKVGNGGAINASQYTVINNTTFGSNVAIDSDSNRAINGGGLFMTGGNPLEITNSTFSYNYAVSGGGIVNVSPSAPTTITNTTISGNHVTDSGGGIETNASMDLLNVTIANNVKDSSTKGSGLNTGPSVDVTVKNVLFDNNLADGLAVSANCGAKSGNFSITTLGGNVSSDDTCGLISQDDKQNATINLIALADNNGGDLPGTTFTHALPRPDIAASAAVDAGVNTGCPNNDQRGSIRPFNGTISGTGDAICDSGAYELYIERADLHIENMTAPDKAVLGEDVTINTVVANGDDATASDVTLTVTLPAELTYVSNDASCAESSGVVTCSFGDLAASAEEGVSIIATASTLKTDVIVAASVDSSTLDPNLENNTHNVTIDIVEETDMSLTAASASPDTLNVGGTSTISVTVLNRGPVTATGVQLSGVVPSLVSFVQGIGCNIDATTNVLTCDVGTLTSGASANVEFDVKAEAAGTAAVTATVTADQKDSDPSDNSGTVNIGISVASSGDGGGGFCAYNPKGKFDPVLPALILMALSFLGFRKLRREGDR